MITLNKNQQRLPIGGHHFPEPGKMIRGESFKEVEDRLKEFRVINGKPAGNPKQEILNYYAEMFPYMVQYGKEGEAYQPPTSNFVRFRHWVQTVWKNPPKKLIIDKEATARWEVCQKCPFNAKPDWGKDQEAQEVERRAFLLRAGRSVPEGLGYCTLHRADISVLSLLDNPALFSAKDKKLPDEPSCWVSSLARQNV